MRDPTRTVWHWWSELGGSTQSVGWRWRACNPHSLYFIHLRGHTFQTPTIDLQLAYYYTTWQFTFCLISSCQLHKKDRPRRFQYIQSIDIFFVSQKILVLSTKYYQIRYVRIRIIGNRHLTCPLSNKITKTKKMLTDISSAFSKTRLAITSKVINRFCWFEIVNTGRSFNFTY